MPCSMGRNKSDILGRSWSQICGGGGRCIRIVVVSLLWLISAVSLHAQTLRFRMAFVYDANPLSAMLILKNEDETLKGSMVNEFGVNFVEFTVKKGRAKIVRLNPMLKKPFLKKVLIKDFELITACLKSETEGVMYSKKGGVFSASCIKQMDEESKLLSLQLEHQKLPLTIYLSQF